MCSLSTPITSKFFNRERTPSVILNFKKKTPLLIGIASQLPLIDSTLVNSFGTMKAAGRSLSSFFLYCDHNALRLCSILFTSVTTVVLSSYPGVLLITGGRGVTLALSAAKEDRQMIHQRRRNTCFVEALTQDTVRSLQYCQKFPFHHTFVRPFGSTLASVVSLCILFSDVVFKVSDMRGSAYASPQRQSVSAKFCRAHR